MLWSIIILLPGALIQSALEALPSDVLGLSAAFVTGVTFLSQTSNWILGLLGPSLAGVAKAQLDLAVRAALVLLPFYLTRKFLIRRAKV